MKTSTVHAMKQVMSYLVVAGAIALTSPAHAAGRCDAPKAGSEARACAAAQQGPDGLRRFVERTRMIYGLYFNDLARPEAEAVAVESDKAPNVGTPADAAVKRASNQ